MVLQDRTSLGLLVGILSPEDISHPADGVCELFNVLNSYSRHISPLRYQTQRPSHTLTARLLTLIADLPLALLGGGDDHGGHVVHVSRGLLQRLQLLVAAVGLHLQYSQSEQKKLGFGWILKRCNGVSSAHECTLTLCL